MVVQFYRVEVRVVAPESGGASKCRSVLRRFSHFSRLYSRVSVQSSLLFAFFPVSSCFVPTARQLRAGLVALFAMADDLAVHSACS